MPFTFSHPAIVLPLLSKHSKWFSATGLIIGSIAPDFEAFITVADIKIYSHTWTGMFWFDIPLGIILAILFHAVVRDPLIENLPLPLAERFDNYRNMHWLSYFRKHIFIVVSSLFIGILSHLVWDAITHLNFYYPDSITSNVKVFGKRLYKILQFGCSFFGLLFVGWFVYKLPVKKVTVKVKMKYQYWLIMTLLAILTGTIIITVFFKDMDIDPILFLYIAISSFLAGLTIVSFIYSFFVKRDHGFI